MTMSPGKMSTSVATAVDSSTIASISSTTDTDDGAQIKDEGKSDSNENSFVRKSINGTEAFVVGLSNGASVEKNENACRAKTNEERIKQEVCEIRGFVATILYLSNFHLVSVERRTTFGFVDIDEQSGGTHQCSCHTKDEIGFDSTHNAATA